MKVSRLASVIEAETVQNIYNDSEVTAVYTSDLLSDVLGNAPDRAVLVTIQAHRNTVAVASTKDCPAIIVCNERPVPPDMLEAAAGEHIAVFVTALNQYTVSGKLYAALNGLSV